MPNNYAAEIDAFLDEYPKLVETTTALRVRMRRDRNSRAPVRLRRSPASNEPPRKSLILNGT